MRTFPPALPLRNTLPKRVSKRDYEENPYQGALITSGHGFTHCPVYLLLFLTQFYAIFPSSPSPFWRKNDGLWKQIPILPFSTGEAGREKPPRRGLDLESGGGSGDPALPPSSLPPLALLRATTFLPFPIPWRPLPPRLPSPEEKQAGTGSLRREGGETGPAPPQQRPGRHLSHLNSTRAEGRGGDAVCPGNH